VLIPTSARLFHRVLPLLMALSLAVGSIPLPAQTPASTAKPEKPTTAPAATSGSNLHTPSDPELIREVQVDVREKDYVGLVWWIPFEFWQISGAKRGIPAESTAQNLKALRDYTIVAVFLAKVSALGSFTFVPIEDLRRDVMLRDAAGNEYRSIPEPSQDAKNLAAIVKPILTSAMGKAGENFDMLFFPARGKDGDVIADAARKGRFEVVLKNNLAGVPESVYEWRTPLTAIAPLRYCPVGKERVHADWEYCPWHGVALEPATK